MEKKVFFSRNKRGWIRIVEAVIALLLIAGTILIVVPKSEITQADKQQKVYDLEVVVLREIELDNNLRTDILKVNLDTNNSNQEAPISVAEKVNSSIPNYLTCFVRVCTIPDICSLQEYVQKDVYAQIVTISAVSIQEQIYNPRKIKIFCWEK